MKVKDVKKLFESLKGEFTAEKYSLTSFNCQTFANRVSMMTMSGKY